MNTYNYLILYELFIVTVTIFTVFGGIFKTTEANVIPVKYSFQTKPLLILVTILIASYPIGIGGDKERYNFLFLNINNKSFDKDIGWEYFVRLIHLVTSDSYLFFLICALIYCYGYYVFYKAVVKKEYVFYFLLTTFGAMGFFAYGTNTIRAGVALALVLIAFTFMKKKKYILFILLSIIAMSFHKSLILVLLALIITQLFSKTKYYYCLWLVCLLISIFDLTFVTAFVQELFENSDKRVVEYIGTRESDLYNASFRIDFLIYSLMPISYGYYQIFHKKVFDALYSQMYNVYILINAFWLLVIRIPFTDRFAYLSWFLIPLLIIYPCFLVENNENAITRIKLSMSILILVLFNFILVIK